MTDTMQTQAAVTVAGTLGCIDNDGARSLTNEEFHDVIARMADHLDDEPAISDPSVWGQAVNGEMEIYFQLVDRAGGPPALSEIANVMSRMSQAVGLIWSHDPAPSAPAGATPVLVPKSQHCDFVPAPA